MTFKRILSDKVSRLILRVKGSISNLIREKSSSKTSSIAVFYTEGFSEGKRNDDYWLVNSDLSPEKILYYYDGQNMNEADKLHCQQKGYRHISLGSKSLRRVFDRAWFPRKNFSPPSFLRHHPKDQIDRYIQINALRLLRRVHYWKCFIEEFNVRVFLCKKEREIDTLLQKIALNKTGVICGLQRSELGHPSRSILGLHPKNILISFGPRAIDQFKPNIDNNQYLIFSGYPYEANKDSAPDIETAIDALKIVTKKFIITLFDNVCGRMANPLRVGHLRVFIENFLDYLEQHKNVVIILKTKKSLVYRELPDLLERFEKLQTGGRLIVDQTPGRNAHVYGRLSDVSIGIGISTPITEIALMGKRAINLDPAHHYHHRFAKPNNKKIYYSDPRLLMKDLESFRQSPSSLDDFGKWDAEVLNEMDLYRDYQSGPKIGQFIKDLDHQLTRESDVNTALNQSVDLYKKKWGKHSVKKLNFDYHSTSEAETLK